MGNVPLDVMFKASPCPSQTLISNDQTKLENVLHFNSPDTLTHKQFLRKFLHYDKEVRSIESISLLLTLLSLLTKWLKLFGNL